MGNCKSTKKWEEMRGVWVDESIGLYSFYTNAGKSHRVMVDENGCTDHIQSKSGRMLDFYDSRVEIMSKFCNDDDIMKCTFALKVCMVGREYRRCLVVLNIVKCEDNPSEFDTFPFVISLSSVTGMKDDLMSMEYSTLKNKPGTGYMYERLFANLNKNFDDMEKHYKRKGRLVRAHFPFLCYYEGLLSFKSFMIYDIAVENIHLHYAESSILGSTDDSGSDEDDDDDGYEINVDNYLNVKKNNVDGTVTEYRQYASDWMSA